MRILVFLIIGLSASPLPAQVPRRALFGDNEPFESFVLKLQAAYATLLATEQSYCEPRFVAGVWITSLNETNRGPYTSYHQFTDSVLHLVKPRVDSIAGPSDGRFRGSFVLRSPFQYDADRQMVAAFDTLSLIFETDWPDGKYELAAINWLTLGDVMRGDGGAAGIKFRWADRTTIVGAEFPLSRQQAQELDIAQSDGVTVRSVYTFEIREEARESACVPTKFDKMRIDTVQVFAGDRVVWQLPTARKPTQRGKRK